MAFLSLLFMTVGTLFAVFRLLTGRAAAVRSSDILLLLGFGLHLAVVAVVFFPCRTKNYSATSYYIINVCHFY